ncbi:hypothetical protein [Micromonospora sp. 067-2]|uniref:hypothetical protein n=1 Tax=Micromonospora sp. 067-2 TaxID=2789270 RepID=UPI00397AF117
MTGAAEGDSEPVEAVRRPSVAALARDRRVWLILAVVAGLLVCCCSTVAGTLVALTTGLLSA